MNEDVFVAGKKFSTEFAVNHGEKEDSRKVSCLNLKMVALLANFFVFRWKIYGSDFEK